MRTRSDLFGTGAVVVVFGVGLSACSNTALATAQRPGEREPLAAHANVTPEAVARYRACVIWIDETTSLDSVSRVTPIEELVEIFPAIAERDGLGDCEVLITGEKPWAVKPVYTFSLPHSVNHIYEEPQCETPGATNASTIFRKEQERLQERSQVECEAMRKAAWAAHLDVEQRTNYKYKQELARSMKDLRAALLGLPTSDDPCSNVVDMLRRIRRSRAPLTAMSITDGIETCRPALVPVDPPNGDVRMVIVLADPEKTDAVPLSDDFDRRRDALYEAAPWIVAIEPFWNLDADIAGTQAAIE